MQREFAWLTVPVLLVLGSPALAQDELLETAGSLFEPIPEQPPELPSLQATPERVELGRMLYFETRLSESHTISCNSCHMVGLGGVDMLETSIGHRWQIGGRNAPTVLNAVFNTAQFWDGRAKDLEEQAGGPIENPVEMASTHGHVVEMLSAIPGYVEMFAKAFPEDADPINIKNVTDSIALFEATLITPNAPFDRYLKGEENALTTEQKEGLQLFVDNGCAACHSGINLGGDQYQPFGVVELPGAEFLPPDDKGRFEVTKSVSDEYVFKCEYARWGGAKDTRRSAHRRGERSSRRVRTAVPSPLASTGIDARGILECHIAATWLCSRKVMNTRTISTGMRQPLSLLP